MGNCPWPWDVRGMGQKVPNGFWSSSVCRAGSLLHCGYSLDVLEEQMRCSLGCEQRQECFIALY